MLGKLLKYEFKYTARIMLLFYGMVAGVTVFSSIIFLFMENMELLAVQEPLYSILYTAIILLYALTVLATYLLSLIYLSVRFYRTMYSAQGYLTHTLPVTPTQTLHSKMIASFVWMIGTTLLLLASFCVFVYVLTRGTFFESDLPSLLEVLEFFYISPARISWYWLVSLLFNCLMLLLMIFTSMSIGQLSTRHKIGASIAAGVIIHYAQQIISLIISFIYMFWGMQNYTGEQAFSALIFSMTNFSLIYTVLLIVGFYVTCRIIVNKRINLE